MKLLKAYSTFEVSKKMGIPRSSIQLYIEKGFITPSESRATGRGTKSLFTIKDLYHLRLFQVLSQRGYSQKVASEKAHTIIIEHYDLFSNDLGWIFLAEMEDEIIIGKAYVDRGFDVELNGKEFSSAVIINLYLIKCEVTNCMKK